MKEILRFNKVIKSLVISGDIALLNVVFLVVYAAFNHQFPENGFPNSLSRVLVLLSLCYLVCNIQSGVVLHYRVIRPEQIIIRALRNMVPFTLLSVTILALCHFSHFSSKMFFNFYLFYALCLMVYRLAFRYFLKLYRKQGGNTRTVVLVGSSDNIVELYHAMTDDPTFGFRVIGYFEDTPSDRFPDTLPYLGAPKDIINYLECTPTEHLYCSLSSSRSEEIVPIINYCENHLVRFFSVPNVRNYLKRRMCFELLGNTPILSIRREPLSQTENVIFKRIFDILFSGLFLCTVFPFIYIITGLAIKISSPGPVFFKQKRSGEDGKEFWCYKFRSMKVNAQSDTLQATANDPRKTKLGEFLRKSSVDELPQFINVLKGDMSIVGPRPHMLKHTEEYSKQINKFMVRHFIKPGITGWAQVTGFRGETKELWQMQGRVQRDIWYIEHWTFLLDLFIIYKTLYNAFHGEKEAY